MVISDISNVGHLSRDEREEYKRLAEIIQNVTGVDYILTSGEGAGEEVIQSLLKRVLTLYFKNQAIDERLKLKRPAERTVW